MSFVSVSVSVSASHCLGTVPHRKAHRNKFSHLVRGEYADNIRSEYITRYFTNSKQMFFFLRFIPYNLLVTLISNRFTQLIFCTIWALFGLKFQWKMPQKQCEKCDLIQWNRCIQLLLKSIHIRANRVKQSAQSAFVVLFSFFSFRKYMAYG